MKPNKAMKMLGYPAGSCYVPQTPVASPYSPLGILRQALASPNVRRGDAARSLLKSRGTSRQSRPTHWLPNLHQSDFLGKTYAVLGQMVSA
ncbi:hypothetical protein [Nostoc sp.]|uniref:hypothetical protein n=1 Tax=Nostoc sp. TaxID=1180 RepID=UPI002FF78AA7